MTVILQHVTVAQAATGINILIAFLQHTLGLGLVVMLVHFIPPMNTALAWNVIGRRIHASLWPTLLGVDSERARGTGLRVGFFSYLSFATTVLVIIAGVIMPLGLTVGPVQQKPLRSIPSVFVEDISPLGLATSPRTGYNYSRICGGWGPVTCPGNLNGNTSVISPSVLERFNATSHGPFGMQFRRYYKGTGGYNYSMLTSRLSITESLILRTGIFAVGGLIVDLDKPGIGLWNHTLPAGITHGGTWSEDVLWLEPVSACVDTNLTIDYQLVDNAFPESVDKYSLTDRGGFFNLTHHYPSLNRDGQNIDLMQHAYKGTVLSNFDAMLSFNNMSRNESYAGKTFPMNSTFFEAGSMQPINMDYLVTDADIYTLCQGYGGADTANISNVAVNCGMLLAPPQRTDGGDPRAPGDNSTWTQRLFGCASATRARMQRVDFSFNGSMNLDQLGISRRDIDTPVLWATEKTEVEIGDVDLFWGRVPDSLEMDPALWTIRSDAFYVPAGASDIWGLPSAGQPSTLVGAAWTAVGDPSDWGSRVTPIADYSGRSNFALLQKFETLVLTDPKNGPAQIRNLIWTDIMANNLMGTDSRTSLLVKEYVPSIAYDLRYSVPAFLLVLLWIPSFIGSAFVLLTGSVKISHLRHLLNHTGAGRVALENSALRRMDAATLSDNSGLVWEDEAHWADGGGRTMLLVAYPDEQGHRKGLEVKVDRLTTATEDSESLLFK
ncbi:hypothetical protein DFH09DRAFT_1274966 [Mycena vulgaris]|nr:hypothetical protein DFH09DRAFT_1274966 [Mycena vulgaris]